MDYELEKHTAYEIASLIKSRKVTPVEVTGYFLDRIDRFNPELNALISSDRAYALRQAGQVESKLSRGDKLSPLAGVPIVIKDNINVKDLPVTCGSKMLADYISVYDATVIEKLKAAGLVIIGKANMDEFAMGSSNEHSYFGRVKNPIDHSRVAGGSSGGSAATVKAGLAPLALGSDTAGSVRLPAAFCGVVGYRPSYGLVSRYGLTAFASSFDQIGVIANDTIDTALLLSVIAGGDKRDSTSIEQPVPDYFRTLDNEVKPPTIGIPSHLLESNLPHEIKLEFELTTTMLEHNNIELIDISLPPADQCLAVYYILACSEAAANLARYDGVRYGYRSENSDSLEEMYINNRTGGFGAEVKRRIMLGTFALSSGFYDKYYRKAHQARRALMARINRAFDRCDLILMPSAPETAFLADQKTADPLAMYLTDTFMTYAPLAKAPAISIPIGNDKSRLPIGFQLMGRYLNDSTVLRGAYLIEGMIHG